MTHQCKASVEIPPVDCSDIESIILEMKTSDRLDTAMAMLIVAISLTISLYSVGTESWWVLAAYWLALVSTGMYLKVGAIDKTRLSDAQVLALANIIYCDLKALHEMQACLKSRGYLKLQDVENLVRAEKKARQMKALLDNSNVQQFMAR